MQKFLISLLLHFFALLPLRLNHLIGTGLGLCLYYFRTSLWRVSKTNIQLCFPELTEAEQQRLLKSSLLELGKQVCEMGPMWLWSSRKILAQLRIVSGKEHLEQAIRNKKGIILLTPHLGCWEIAGLYLGATLPVTILYSRPKIKALDDIVRRARIRSGAHLVATDITGVKAIFGALRKGEGTGILPDQSPDDSNSGVFAPFFNIPTLTMTFISKLASKTEASIVMGYAERLPKGRGYHLHIRSVDPDIASSDPLVSASALNKTIEHYIKEQPTQYQWSYKRFKKRPAGEPKCY